MLNNIPLGILAWGGRFIDKQFVKRYEFVPTDLFIGTTGVEFYKNTSTAVLGKKTNSILF